MGTKIISSRSEIEDNILEQIQEVLFLLFNTLLFDGNGQEEPAGDIEGAIKQLNAASEAICVSHELLRESLERAIVELSVASINLDVALQHLRATYTVFHELTNSPVNDELFRHTFDLLKREGCAKVEFATDLSNPILLDTNVTFDENKLAEALKEAIVYYNTTIIQSHP